MLKSAKGNSNNIKRVIKKRRARVLEEEEKEKAERRREEGGREGGWRSPSPSLFGALGLGHFLDRAIPFWD